MPDEDARTLVDGNGIVLASYAGSILDGGTAAGQAPGYKGEHGERCFMIRPLEDPDAAQYSDTYRTPKQGPVCEFLPAES